MDPIKSVRFSAEAEGYRLLRIPCLLTPDQDSILALFEARYGCSDWAQIDLLLYISRDGGETFETRLLVKADGAQTVNNPVLIDAGNGVIHFLYCVQYGVEAMGGGVYYRRSDDGGSSFSPPRNITAATLPDYRNAFATGPTHGLAAADGGLFVPVWLVPKAAGRELMSHHPAELRMLYSTDDGEHWQMSAAAPEGEGPDPNEACAVALDDGRLLLNIRSGRVRRRCFSVYDPTCGTFTPIRRSDIPDPICCGAICRWENAIFVCGCEDEQARRNLTIRVSADGGEHWSYLLTVEPGEAGYPDIACTADGRLAVLYEADRESTALLKLYSLPDEILQRI